jgi:glutamate synthase (NADPH/NADH)
VQVTNPAIDPFREAVVTSLRCFVGPEGDITASSPAHAQRLDLAGPVLRPQEMEALKVMGASGWKTQVGASSAHGCQLLCCSPPPGSPHSPTTL